MLIKGNLRTFQHSWKFFYVIFTIFTINWHLIPIFSSPHNIWLGKTFGSTLQCHIRSFPHNQVIACQWFHDNWRNWKVSSEKKFCLVHWTTNECLTYRQPEGSPSAISWDLCWPEKVLIVKSLMPFFRLYWMSTYLTHIPSPVSFLDFSYV